MPGIQQYMETALYSTQNGYMFDLCDGHQFQQSPIYSRNSNAMQIILNTDDIEVVNPLGSHVQKHKLPMCYYTLGNILHQFRSNLACMQLLAVAKTVDIRKFGTERLLSAFVIL